MRNELFHVSDFGSLIRVGEVNVGYGMVDMYRCEICGAEFDSTDYQRFATLKDGVIVDYKNRPVVKKDD